MLENDEKNKVMSKTISSKCSYGHVDCNFAETSEENDFGGRKGFVRAFSQKDSAVFFFQMGSWHAKSFYEELQSSFDNPA